MIAIARETRNDHSFLHDREWQVIIDRLNCSPREIEIVQYVMSDLKETAIASRLDISSHTVHTHMKRLYAKLGVASRVELILRVFREYADFVREEAVSDGDEGFGVIRTAA